MTFLCRKRLDEWKQEDFLPKINIIERPDFDDLTDLKEVLQGYDIFYSTLGGSSNSGKEMVKKVDFDYPIKFA
jgi:hypothetical protein